MIKMIFFKLDLNTTSPQNILNLAPNFCGTKYKNVVGNSKFCILQAVSFQIFPFCLFLKHIYFIKELRGDFEYILAILT